MSRLIELKDSAEILSEDEYSKFRDWFWDYENEKLDKKIKSDIHFGKLQALGDKAKRDFKEGSCFEL